MQNMYLGSMSLCPVARWVVWSRVSDKALTDLAGSEAAIVTGRAEQVSNDATQRNDVALELSECSLAREESIYLRRAGLVEAMQLTRESLVGRGVDLYDCLFFTFVVVV